MILSHVVIDDFFEGLADLTKFAKGLELVEETQVSVYQGFRASKAINLTGIAERISQTVHESLKPAAHLGHGIVRSSRNRENVKRKYAYLNSGHWIGVLNLCGGVDVNLSGVKFLQHSRTQTENVLLNEKNFRKLGVTTLDEAKNEFSNIITQECETSENWKQTLFIPSKRNRLTLFRPWGWHCPHHGAQSNATESLDYYIVLERA